MHIKTLKTQDWSFCGAAAASLGEHSTSSHENLVQAFNPGSSTYQIKASPTGGATKKIFKHKLACNIWLWNSFSSSFSHANRCIAVLFHLALEHLPLLHPQAQLHIWIAQNAFFTVLITEPHLRDTDSASLGDGNGNLYVYFFSKHLILFI